MYEDEPFSYLNPEQRAEAQVGANRQATRFLGLVRLGLVTEVIQSGGSGDLRELGVKPPPTTKPADY